MSRPSHEPPPDRRGSAAFRLRISEHAARWWVLGLFALVLLATAWLADDAYISFRTVDNFVAGRGLTWNDGERVQAFTHPLWFFVNAGLYALTGEIYFTALALCMVCSLTVVALLVFRLAKTKETIFLVLLAFVLSKGLVDYGTSGLESPLSYLLVVLFVWAGWRSDAEGSGLLPLAALTALIGLNRLDLLVIVAPALGLVWLRARRREQVLALAVTVLPLLAWEVFSVVYFGSPVPNTALAKLGGGISRLERLSQGIGYYVSSLFQDGFTVVFGGWLLARAFRRQHPFGRALAFGVGLYLVYLLWIGGDSMGGRFLAVPFLVLFVLFLVDLTDLRAELRPARWAGIVLVLLLVRIGAGLASENIDLAGIGDQRRVWYPFTGLVYTLWENPWPEMGWRIVPGEDCPATSCIVAKDTIGLYGFYSGPQVVIVDGMTLADPFRARLPGRRKRGSSITWHHDWGPDHISRVVPAGYLESLRTGENRIVDPDLAVFYGAVTRVTRGPLWTRERWREIWRINTGAYDAGIERWAERNPQLFVFGAGAVGREPASP